ncbi:MAG: DUF4358 domain-containing protein [Bacilli bacterium]|nr:DUF4358 domain-containing protein [Bacilli bacterium]
MKKIIICLIGILLLTGCGTSSNSEATFDMNAASKSLDAEMKDMVSMEDRELEAIYGIDLSLMDEYVIKSNSNKDGSVYAIIKVSDKNKDEVKKQMDNFFETLESQSSLYSPEAVGILEDRVQTSVGNYLIYISYKDTDKAYDLVKENIK